MSPSILGRRAWLAMPLLAALAMTTSPALAASTPSPAITAPANAPPSTRAFARFSMTKRTAYVGESVPVTFRAYYPAGMGVTITGAPTVSSTDFTLAFGKPEQGRATMGDNDYLAVTWKGHLSPVRDGHYDLKVTIPSTLEWQTVTRRAPPSIGADDGFGDLLGSLGDANGGGDPFAAMQQRMQSMMNRAMQDVDVVGAVQKKDVELSSTSAPLTVLPLPTDGRPPSFSGAVGHFDIDSHADATRVRVGEPIELTLQVHGQGNLDRVSTPGVAESDDFKTYAPTVTQKDDSKTFAQAIVPEKPGSTEIPPVAFAYFDPDSARYVTAQSKAIPLEVKPGQALTATLGGKVPDATTGPALAPNAEVDGPTLRTLRPLYTRSGFWFGQLAPLGMLAVGSALVVRRRRIAADPHYALRRGAKRTLRRQRAAMAASLAARDAPAYFGAARSALQQRLGAQWGVVPEAITLVEIERRMKGPQLATLRVVFEADAARFGAGRIDHDLARCNDEVQRVLAHPEDS